MATVNDSVIFDLETFDTRYSAVVLTLGMVAFDSDKEYTFQEIIKQGTHLKFDVGSQRAAGRTISEDTVNWWKQQSNEAKQFVLPNPREDIPYEYMLDAIDEYLDRMKVHRNTAKFYCRGIDFDYVILKDIADNQNRPMFCRYYNMRCIRTVIDILAGEHAKRVELMKTPEGFIAHNALHDCANDYIKIMTAGKIGE